MPISRGLLSTALAALLLGLPAAAAVGQCPDGLYDRAGWTATLPFDPGHDVEGEITIIDEFTLQVEGFSYDGTAPAVYFYLGAENTDDAFDNGLELQPQLDRPYSDERLTLRLPMGESLDDYTAISVWCEQFSVNFTSASFVEPAEMNARAGWVADLPRGAHQAEGKATIIADRFIYVEDFTYDGTAPQVYFYLGATDAHDDFVNGLETQPRLLRAYDNESLVVTLPVGTSVDGYSAISVWCSAFDASFTSATFAPSVVGDTDA
ncbi:MAG: DM13 domain-containing protein, partial [Phycisphaerales bacterium JB038]